MLWTLYTSGLCVLDGADADVLGRGGEEVLLDVGGQDATEAFEDVGHSDEAREILEGLLVGTLKRQVCHTRFQRFSHWGLCPTLHISDADDFTQAGDPAPKTTAPSSSSSAAAGSGLSVGLYAFVLLGGALAFGAYKYLQSQEQKIAI